MEELMVDDLVCLWAEVKALQKVEMKVLMWAKLKVVPMVPKLADC